MLAPLEMTVAAYPALVWVVLLATSSHVWKGLTNVDVELFVLAIGVAVAVYVRVCHRRISGSRYRALFLPVTACLCAGAIFVATPPIHHYDLIGARLFVRRHPELPPPTRDAIVCGVVVEGMSAEEAGAAGGPSSWLTLNGKLERLTFNNLSQFGGDRPVAFHAYMVDGRVHEIERLNDVALCEHAAPDDAGYPLAGFWKEDCAQSFGLRFEPGGSGRYGVHFCGPGGCGELSECTSIPDGKNYDLIDPDTIVQRRGPPFTYKRCAP